MNAADGTLASLSGGAREPLDGGRTLADAARQLGSAVPTTLLVREDHGGTIGVFGGREAMRAVREHRPPGTPLTELVGPAHILSSKTPLVEACRHMLRHGTLALVLSDGAGELPVVVEGATLLHKGLASRSAGDATVADVANLVTPFLDEHRSLADAADLMWCSRASTLIVTRDGRPVATVDERELFTHYAASGWSSRVPLAGCRLAPLDAIPGDAPLADAVGRVLERDGRSLPVRGIDRDLFGLVGMRELLQFLVHRANGTGIRAAVHDDTETPNDFARDLARIAGSGEMFTRVFHTSPIAKALTDLDSGTFFEINAAFSRMTGYGAAEVIGRSSRDLGLFVDPTQRTTIVATLRERGHIDGVEVSIRTKAGSVFTGQFHAAVLELSDRHVMISQVMDITENRQAERAAREIDRRRQMLMDASLDGIAILDSDHRLIEANARMAEMLGYAPDEILGLRTWDWEANLSETDIRASFPDLSKVEQRFESRHRRKDGTVFDVEISAKGREIDGEPVVLTIVRDISERKQAEEARLQIERELQQTRKMEALGQLTGGVAHEFNNMLAIILGHAELLRARLGADAGPRIVGYLDHIEKAGGRARDLIRQMLTFSRPREDVPERIALRPAIRETVTLVRASLPSSIEVFFHGDSGLPDVRLDPGELQQIMTNLLVNARDAVGGKGRIDVDVQRYVGDEGRICQQCQGEIRGEWVQVSVTDNGTGIPPEQIPRIFEPFFTTKTVGKGTGLGLSVVLGLIEHNDGHIIVESVPGQGTTFRLLFPPVDTLTDARQEPDAALPAPTTLSGRVLIVDDEPALTAFLAEAIGSHGVDTVTCNDSREALTLLESTAEAFDLVITDQTMPGLLGTELAARAKVARPRLPVILCTGHSEQVDASNVADFGIDGYLAKPVELDLLWRALDETLKAG